MNKNKEQFKVDGTTHIVDRHGNKFKVHHPNGDGTYTLDAKNISEAEKAVRDWHKNNG
jgi:hypothetical protein